ncbi:PDZ domain-containing protein [Haloferula sp. A504]|uniref:PDZ domain-containing protein n=1 Tax=Haloferula sp. A504 TaxID=3373601 RepID=UPI0031C2E0A8|nr:PDZ domain-containing protein [Verrucomicrobiaceae bacterium E54]
MRTWLVLLALVVAVLPSRAVEPPEELLKELSSEHYPQRIKAQRALEDWAAEAGDEGLGWLLETSSAHDEPEVRNRVFEVLRSQVMSQLDRERPGFIGITMVGFQVDLEGEKVPAVAITSVQKGSPADRTGLREGDRILGIDGERWTEGDTPDQLARKVGGMKPGEEIELEVAREDEVKTFALKLAPRPWAAGEWGELRQMRAVPFAGRFSLENVEKEERDKAFREWLQKRTPGPGAGAR